MRVMGKPCQQRHVKSVFCLYTDLDFVLIPGCALVFPESIQPQIGSSRNVHRPFPDKFSGGLEM